MKNVLFLLSLILLFACGETTTKQETEETTTTEQVDQAVETTSETTEETTTESKNEDLLGYYVGRFVASKYDKKKNYSHANKINISIDKIEGDKLIGHSVVAGNDRPFEGTFTKTPQGIKVIAKEPGDDRYDGRFEFELDAEANRIKGTWIANDSKLAVYERSYSLGKKTFSYNPKLDLPEETGWADLYNGTNEYTDEGEFLTEDVIKYNASKVALKKEDISNMYKGDIEVMRNAIYARHGYSFKNRKMRYVFDHVNWYIPVSTDIRSNLTDLEKKNIDLLKRYEEHADRYYDTYGR